MRTYESFFSSELCKPSGNVRPPSSPTPGLGFAKLQERLGEINRTQHPCPLGKVIPLKTELIIVPGLGLPLQTTPSRVCFFGRPSPGAAHTCEPAPAGETSPRKAFCRADSSPGPRSEEPLQAFNFQMRPCCL